MSDYYFIAIGGVGQSALAKILLSLGFSVSGSDKNKSKYTDLIENLGGKVFIGHDKNNIQDNPVVVVSSAIKEDNPELVEAKRRNLKIIHRSDCLKIISEKFPCFIGLSGTHGKTTTSGLLSFVLEKLNLNPSYAVGGIIPNLKTNSRGDKNSKYFIAELDESDRTITKYRPDILLINNIEEDHLDHYKDLDDIISVFNNLVLSLDKTAKVFINNDDFGVQKLNIKNPITYGIKSNAVYKAKNIIFKDLKTSFDVYKSDKLLGTIKLIIPGLHNVYNTLGIVSILDNSGFNFNDYKDYFFEFKGMSRRFQLVGETKGIKIIDDYAHHPNEIKSTLSALDEIKKRKVVIFQPHRYTRLKSLWNEFLDSFNNIDELYVVDVFSAGDKFDNEFNSKTFTDKIKLKGIKASYIEGEISSVAEKITPKLQSGDIVLTLGAGDITKVGGEINDILSK